MKYHLVTRYGDDTAPVENTEEDPIHGIGQRATDAPQTGLLFQVYAKKPMKNTQTDALSLTQLRI
eukprot:3656049-Ditylum_brightwellii.AAC.1